MSTSIGQQVLMTADTSHNNIWILQCFLSVTKQLNLKSLNATE